MFQRLSILPQSPCCGCHTAPASSDWIDTESRQARLSGFLAEFSVPGRSTIAEPRVRQRLAKGVPKGMSGCFLHCKVTDQSGPTFLGPQRNVSACLSVTLTCPHLF
jgi:hypothetical protein